MTPARPTWHLSARSFGAIALVPLSFAVTGARVSELDPKDSRVLGGEMKSAGVLRFSVRCAERTPRSSRDIGSCRGVSVSAHKALSVLATYRRIWHRSDRYG